jgi:hypothetical protein
MMHLFKVYGEDTPHQDDGAPFKVYLIIAPDEPTARAYAPSGFRVDRIEITKTYPAATGTPERAGWVGGELPLVGGA